MSDSMLHLSVDSLENLYVPELHRECFSVLGEEEKSYFDSIKSKARRKQFLAGRMLVRRMLSKANVGSAWKLTAKSGIKPVVLGMPNIHFSISHCNNWIVCALSDTDVGIDIECVKPGRATQSLAKLVCNPQEIEYMSGFTSQLFDIYFTELWTIKEACVKRRGSGLDFEYMKSLSAEKTERDVLGDGMTMSFMDRGINYFVSLVSNNLQLLQIEGVHSPFSGWSLSLESPVESR